MIQVSIKATTSRDRHLPMRCFTLPVPQLRESFHLGRQLRASPRLLHPQPQLLVAGCPLVSPVSGVCSNILFFLIDDINRNLNCWLYSELLSHIFRRLVGLNKLMVASGAIPDPQDTSEQKSVFEDVNIIDLETENSSNVQEGEEEENEESFQDALEGRSDEVNNTTPVEKSVQEEPAVVSTLQKNDEGVVEEDEIDTVGVDETRVEEKDLTQSSD
mmetsp:Transcript_22785/g.42539  ORF Transcript_22785/g.42539 Transcript_22785/m.42539 type:complete len:216 (+) Transcript_22785:1208-1855(+)